MVTVTRVAKAAIPALFAVTVVSRSAAFAPDTAPTAESVLRELKAGNAHHAAHHYTHPPATK